MNIHRALSDVARIRAQLDRTEAYRGFRSTAVGFSVLAIIAGIVVEQTWLPDPELDISRFLAIWFAVAGFSAIFAATEMIIRARSSQNRMVWRMHYSLIGQLSPSLIVGFILTLVIATHSMQSRQSMELENNIGSLAWILPGMWAMLYGVGLFSCERHLPRQSKYVAAFLICAGTLVMITNWYTQKFGGWQMLVTFGVGQFWMSLLLYWNVERQSDRARMEEKP